jgi:glyoxylase-like metal-dependent hydrolase (beta-lactamase superfamily II)
MIECTTHDDVVRIRMATWRTRAAGYDVSAYLVHGVLIDTGFRHVGSSLSRVLREIRPRGAIVTHWHEDHAGNAPRLAASSMPMWMAPYTETQLRSRPQVKLYRHVVWGRPRRLEGMLVPLDPAPLELIPTPGHSEDHHVVFDRHTRTVFSGDLWLGVKVRIVGASENPYQIIASLSRVAALEPQRMFDAHRGMVENPIEALEAKRAWLEDTVGAIERSLDAGHGEREIVHALLGGEEHTALVSQGEYSRRNLVRAVIRSRQLSVHREL